MNETNDDVLPDHLRNLLTSIINRPLPRIQESDFIRYFLAGFAGKIDNVPLINWLDVAGNALSAVEVCKGEEVLYTIPPLFGSTTVSPASGQSGTIGEIVAHAQKLNRVHPTQGDRYMQEALADRISTQENDFKAIRTMNDIFARYGIETVRLPSEAVAVAEKHANEKPQIIGFEEL